MIKLLKNIINQILLVFENFGRYTSLIAIIFRSYKSWGLYFSNAVDQMIMIGSKSIPIVVFTSFFTVLNTRARFRRFSP